MTFKEAKILIDEARKLRYHGTQWEQNFVSRLLALAPVKLTNGQAQSVTILYSRASGSFGHEKREIIGRKTVDLSGFND